MKYKYMHTIDGQLARYEIGRQICFVNKYGNFIGKLVPTLKQIKKEQKLSCEWRKQRGYDYDKKDYSWIRVKV